MLKTPDWGMMIVLYFFFGGIAGGAYFTAAIADNVGGPRSSRVALVGYLLSLPLVALCGLLLIADLGVPTRFLNMMRTLKFWDPMSLGAWAVGVFGLFSFVSSVMCFGPFDLMRAMVLDAPKKPLQLREIDGRIFIERPVGDIDKIGRRLKRQLRRCGLVHRKGRAAQRDGPAVLE